MKKLMMTVAAIAVSATSSFAIGLGDVDHLVDNQFSDQTWADVFFVAYADEQGGKIFYDQESVVHYLEGEIETAELTLELNYEELPLWESGSDEYFEVVKRIHGLNGKILGAGKLLTAIDDLDDTSAIDAATATIEHLTKQSAYLSEQVVSLNGQLSTIAADTAAEVAAEFEADISVLNDQIADQNAEVADLEATVMTATEVNTELKGELFTANANNELLVTELNTANELANNNYDSLLDSVKTLEAEAKVAEESHAAAVNAIAEYNSNDAARYENDPAAHLHAIYGYVLQLRAQLGL